MMKDKENGSSKDIILRIVLISWEDIDILLDIMDWLTDNILSFVLPKSMINRQHEERVYDYLWLAADGMKMQG